MTTATQEKLIYSDLESLKEVRKIVYTQRGSGVPRILKDAHDIVDFIRAFGHLNLHWQDSLDCWRFIGTADNLLTGVSVFGSDPFSR